MKVCIAGGGRVGRYLAQNLLANRHKVVIIEPVEAQCRMLADTLDISVICGNSISTDTLRTADVASCDAFVAVTGSDEDNLVACQIAKQEFGVNRTVARASNPKNRGLLHTLGVDTVVCGTDNLSHILERLWAVLVFLARCRACSFAAVLGARTLTVYSGIVLPVRQVFPRRAVTGVQQLRTPLLRLAGASVLIISAPGSRMFLPAVPAAQAGALAHALAEELP